MNYIFRPNSSASDLCRFGVIQQFLAWYNNDHRHSGIGYMTPTVVHHGHAQECWQQRATTLRAAFFANPNRFKGNAPRPHQLPIAAWINPPKKEPDP
jgi:putative transposase